MLHLTLKAVRNADFPSGTPSGLPVPNPSVAGCPDLQFCQAMMQHWIQENGLGAGNLHSTAGQVRERGVLLGRIAFNGRWIPEVTDEESLGDLASRGIILTLGA